MHKNIIGWQADKRERMHSQTQTQTHCLCQRYLQLHSEFFNGWRKCAQNNGRIYLTSLICQVLIFAIRLYPLYGKQSVTSCVHQDGIQLQHYRKSPLAAVINSTQDSDQCAS